jgi:hypothetical protein
MDVHVYSVLRVGSANGYAQSVGSRPMHNLRRSHWERRSFSLGRREWGNGGRWIVIRCYGVDNKRRNFRGFGGAEVSGILCGVFL